jgi:hypothetical protein
MAKNTLKDLRDHLFESLEDLKDNPDQKVDAEALRLKIEKAKAVSIVSAAIVDTVRIQLKAHEVMGRQFDNDPFFPLSEDERAEKAALELRPKPNGHSRQ